MSTTRRPGSTKPMQVRSERPTKRVRRSAGTAASIVTRERILDVAVRLFARRGIDAVSTRDITNAARVNNAAIHYHFGNKQGLIKAAVASRTERWANRRTELLDKIDQQQEPTLEDVIAAFVIPLAEQAADRKRGHTSDLKFLTRLETYPEVVSLISDSFKTQTDRYFAALTRVTPHLTPDVRALRFAFLRQLVRPILSQTDTPIYSWLQQEAPRAQAELPQRLIEFLTAAFRAP